MIHVVVKQNSHLQLQQLNKLFSNISQCYIVYKENTSKKWKNYFSSSLCWKKKQILGSGYLLARKTSKKKSRTHLINSFGRRLTLLIFVQLASQKWNQRIVCALGKKYIYKSVGVEFIFENVFEHIFDGGKKVGDWWRLKKFNHCRSD